MIIAGNRIYEKCHDCGKLVQINKWLGGVHFCLSPEERAYKRRCEQMLQAQLNYKPLNIENVFKMAVGAYNKHPAPNTSKEE